jgi:lipopolysaccharide/colanic/teichoic acid biosynthesis glycosyltransferase
VTGADGVRRAADLVVGLLGVVVTAPLGLAAAIATRCSLGPGVLYGQERLGRGGRPFVLWKFRTMRHAAPGRADPGLDHLRVSRVGALLRSSSLDELPSLLNVVRGDLALVGPRPLPVHYWDRFFDDEYERFLVRPGVTGLAQVSGRNRLSWDERLALDVRYVRTRSLLGDLRILLRTVPVVLARSGVDRGDGASMPPLPAGRAGAATRGSPAPGQASRSAYASSVRATTRA